MPPPPPQVWNVPTDPIGLALTAARSLFFTPPPIPLSSSVFPFSLRFSPSRRRRGFYPPPPRHPLNGSRTRIFIIIIVIITIIIAIRAHGFCARRGSRRSPPTLVLLYSTTRLHAAPPYHYYIPVSRTRSSFLVTSRSRHVTRRRSQGTSHHSFLSPSSLSPHIVAAAFFSQQPSPRTQSVAVRATHSSGVLTCSCQHRRRRRRRCHYRAGR